MDDDVFHSDGGHMDQEDISRASKVYDVLFPVNDETGDLGESTETGTGALAAAQRGLNNARAERRKATKALLGAKSVAATKKANKDVSKAKLKVVGKKNFAKLREKRAEQKLKKAKRKEKKARKKILKAKGLKATLKAEKKFRRAMKKVKKDKSKVSAMGTKLLKKPSKKKLEKKAM